MLSSFEEKMKDVHTVNIADYVNARGTLAGKSAADSIAVSLQERPAAVPASNGAAARADQTEGCIIVMFFTVVNFGIDNDDLHHACCT